MEKVGCCLQEALGKETSMTEELEQLEHRMMSKRLCAMSLLINVHLVIAHLLPAVDSALLLSETN